MKTLTAFFCAALIVGTIFLIGIFLFALLMDWSKHVAR